MPSAPTSPCTARSRASISCDRSRSTARARPYGSGTGAKRAQERLLHDAVNDALTGLPNRELFLDRLAIAAKRATLEPLVRPALLFIDIDKFKSANTAFGLVVGDSLLLTVARRLGRNL